MVESVANGAEANSSSSGSTCVLLVEQDGGSIKSLERVFARAPITIEMRTRPDEQAALDYFLEPGENEERKNVHLIVLGRDVPIPGGLRFLRILRGDDRYKKIPIIVLTYADKADSVQAAYQGVADSVISEVNVPAGMTNIIDTVIRSWFQTARETYAW